jgi:hypothetical protein
VCVVTIMQVPSAITAKAAGVQRACVAAPLPTGSSACSVNPPPAGDRGAAASRDVVPGPRLTAKERRRLEEVMHSGHIALAAMPAVERIIATDKAVMIKAPKQVMMVLVDGGVMAMCDYDSGVCGCDNDGAQGDGDVRGGPYWKRHSRRLAFP